MFHHWSAGEQMGKEEKGGAPKVLTRHPSEFVKLKTRMQKSRTILLLSSLAKSLFSDVFSVKRQDSAYLCLKMYLTPGPASLLSKQRVLRRGTARQHFLYLFVCIFSLCDSGFEMFRSTATGVSRLRHKLVEESKILLRVDKRNIFVCLIAKIDRQQQIGSQ